MYSDYQLITSPSGEPEALFAAYPGSPHVRIDLALFPCQPVKDFISAALKAETAEHHYDHDGHRYRVSRTPTTTGYALAIAVPIRSLGPLDDIVKPTDLSAIREAVDAGGLILILGEHNSGKTQLAATIFTDTLSRHGGVGYAYQDPPEFSIEGPYGANGYAVVVPITSNQYTGATKAARRTRAKAWLFSELRDPSAAAAVIHLGLAGPPVIATSHGSDVISGLIGTLAHAAIADGNATATLANALSCAIHVRATHKGSHVILATEILTIPAQKSTPARATIRTGRLEQLALYRPSQSGGPR